MDLVTDLNLVGASPAFAEAVRTIRLFASCDATVLLYGETGTGKEVAARAIHYLGARRDFPFIPVNCGAIPETLIENELFGHARGAFTDAREPGPGVIADAEGGTLFLDEIEALSPRGQVALLRFLQDQIYRPLGARRTVCANVRVIAVSNENLSKLQHAGRFRRDLYFRLNIMSLEMPALRDRPDDIQLLTEHFLRRLSLQYGVHPKRLAPDTIRMLRTYRWPGNVRELENLIHREFLLAHDDVVRIGEATLAPSNREEKDQFIPFEVSSCEELAHAKARLVAEFERAFLLRMLAETSGNVSLAARRCGKERRTFGKLLKKYGIDRTSFLHR